MADLRFEEAEKIKDILEESSRLRYLLMDTYSVPLNEITAIRLDSDNFKIDVFHGMTYYRFKAKGLDHILRFSPGTRNMEMVLDPAMAQAIYGIVSEFAA